jgi:hypothetical protein
VADVIRQMQAGIAVELRRRQIRTSQGSTVWQAM